MLGRAVDAEPLIFFLFCFFNLTLFFGGGAWWGPGVAGEAGAAARRADAAAGGARPGHAARNGRPIAALVQPQRPRQGARRHVAPGAGHAPSTRPHLR